MAGTSAAEPGPRSRVSSIPGAFGTSAGWPLPASPAPSDGAVSAAPPASSHVTSPRRGRSTARRLPNRNSLQPCRPLASRMPRPMAPLVAPISDHGQGRELRREPGPLPQAAHPRSVPPRSESAFRRQVPVLRSSLALGALRPGRHQAAALPPRARLPTRVRALPRRARVLDPRATSYSPEPACRVPPVDFCNRVDPRARLRAVQSPALDATASRRTPGGRASFEALSAELPQARDRRDDSRGPPLRRPLAAVDLPRPVRPGHPMSRVRAPHRPETGAAGRPCG